MKNYLNQLLVCSILILTTNYNYSQPGTLDASFGTGGIVNTNIGPGDDKGYAVVMQPDGKILAAGLSNTGTSNDFCLVRYLPDGTLDPTFGTGGIATTAIGSGDDYGQAIAIQPDGKILVTGYAWNGSNYDIATVRYQTNGIPDPTFALSGICTFPIGSLDDKCYSISLQTDGKILLGGYTDNGSDEDFALIRLMPNGVFDASFGTGGIVTTDFAGFEDIGRSVAIQPDGKIILGGWTDDGTDYNFAIARYNTDGSLDNTFSSNGWTTTDMSGANDQGYSVLIQSDGKIIMGGSMVVLVDQDFGIVRYNPDGSLDNTFDTDGIVTTDFFGANDLLYSMAIQADNKILTAGKVFNALDSDFGLTRYNVDGSLDNSFDTDGRVTTDLGGTGDVGWAITIQPDARGVVVGSGTVTGVTMSAARYNLCSPGDTTVSQVGITLTANGNGLYQWVNCDSAFNAIPGETGQSFTPTVNGNYAVIINNGGCKDTSACYTINSVGIESNDLFESFRAYPNPTNGVVNITFNEIIENAWLKLSTISGKVIYNVTYTSGGIQTVDLSALPAGMYVLEVGNNHNHTVKKIIRN